jgi:hypothetical protein
MVKGKRISITLSPGDEYYLTAYLKQKKRWRDLAALARDAIFQLVARNPLTEAQTTRAIQGDGSEPEEGSAVLRRGL